MVIASLILGLLSVGTVLAGITATVRARTLEERLTAIEEILKELMNGEVEYFACGVCGNQVVASGNKAYCRNCNSFYVKNEL